MATSPKQRVCGSCTLCCRVMRVNALEKPMHTWCKHCIKDKGCSIYETRPEECRAFECMWLADREGHFLEDELKPDRCRVVLQPLVNGATIVHGDPHRPGAWRNPKILAKLRKLAIQGYPVSVEEGKKWWIITATHEWSVPDCYKHEGEDGLVWLECPPEVQIQIGLYCRPESYQLGSGSPLEGLKRRA